ncbi:MAG: ATPase [Naasia sp.]|nr:ATPase [Naasia sp.]
MPVTSVEKDPDALTLTITADFGASLERLWEAYTDPRQIVRFWGPPSFPATFLRHDAAPGGRSVYRMTGVDSGESHGGYWEWVSVDAPRSFVVVDGFLGDDGEPNTELPTMEARFEFSATDTGSRLVTTTTFPSLEQLEQLIEMGMIEGTKEAMAQIDDVLADLASFAADRGAEAQILSDTQIRVARVIRGTVEQVWRAHNDADLMRKWLLGPDGWTMPVCDIATKVGDTYRYEWEQEGDPSTRFGFTGELLENEPPHRAVTSEAMIGMDFPATLNELTLTPVTGGTLLTMVAAYANAEQRDAILATGMTDGMETSYARLESVLGADAAAREPVGAGA